MTAIVVTKRGADRGGWRGDFPLDDTIGPDVTIDLDALEPPIHPVWWLRLRVFIDWHARAGVRVGLLPPRDVAAAAIVRAAGIESTRDMRAEIRDEVLLPVTVLRTLPEVDQLSERLRIKLGWDEDDLLPLADAFHMGISELAQNAVEHGRNPMGAYVAVGRTRTGSVCLAVGDLGIGIPEHIRQRYPEWADDEFAITQATAEGVTGTGDPRRGLGLSETMDSALTGASSGARLDVRSLRGAVRVDMVQAKRTYDARAERYRRGTWLSLELSRAM